MDFKFNFANPCKEKGEDKSTLHHTFPETEEKDNVLYGNVQKIDPSTVDENYFKTASEKYNSIKIGQHTIKYLPSSTVIQVKKWLNLDSALRLSEDSQSDLLPGVYEGGLKLWECALDLAHFLYDNVCLTPNSNVLELGCGPGLPAILAYLNGCQVTFQDYNAEVLELATIPNIMLNTPQNKRSDIPRLCSFVAGDWHNIEEKYYHDNDGENVKFDVILSSETIYEKQSHRKLLNLMKQALVPDGVIYLAAKSHYFGVGGTLDDFEHLVMMDDSFSWKVLNSISDGVQRIIVQLNFKKR